MSSVMTLVPSIAGGAGCFFILIWLAMMIGAIVGGILFLVAVWRMSKAHERIADTLEISLLDQRHKSPLAELSEPSGFSEPAECIKCQTTIPAGQTDCPHCGAPRAGSQ